MKNLIWYIAEGIVGFFFSCRFAHELQPAQHFRGLIPERAATVGHLKQPNAAAGSVCFDEDGLPGPVNCEVPVDYAQLRNECMAFFAASMTSGNCGIR